ncbi:SUKH-4 family immunity protein, partial [Streptomyces sp. NPDC056287]|uniref:SUKH-4 family immunity protein n=3 Tax=Streptomyces TaxID=1883 RepID=UPI0035D71CB9
MSRRTLIEIEQGRTTGSPATWRENGRGETGVAGSAFVDAEDFEDASEGAGEWPVIGCPLNAQLALDPGFGQVHAFDADEKTVQELHTDVSSLGQVTLRFQRLLKEFTFSGDDGDEEAAFEYLDREVERIRQETSSIAPLPFQDDETVWSVVGEEIAAGQRFRGNSPGARTRTSHFARLRPAGQIRR